MRAALHNLADGRRELRQAFAALEGPADPARRRVAAAALVVFTGIADDDYEDFEAAVATLVAGSGSGSGSGTANRAPADEALPSDAGEALLAEAGALVAGWFTALDDPTLPSRATAIVRSLADEQIDAALRCCAGLAALGYFHARMDLESVLWVELATRPLRRAERVGARLADEAFHMIVQALYQCEAAARATALRLQRSESGAPPLPEIELKLQLLDAQIALGAGLADSGRAALQRAEPLLSPRAPRQASWWHLLRSRLDLLEGRQRQALTHARLALRLGSESHLPERWMGVTVMQEGQVLMAGGEYALALPFFERAGRAASGSQAQFCWCLAHLARALLHFRQDDGGVGGRQGGTDGGREGGAEAGRRELASGLALARQLSWLHFFRACPPVAVAVCALALEHQIEAPFVREVIAARGLQAMRPDLASWPWPVRVLTLGRLRIEVDGQALAFKGKVAKKPLELLLFIVTAGGAEVAASAAAFALWRDLEGDKAMAALTVALHRLRKLLGHEGAVLLELGRLSLNAKRVWVDCLAFEQLADSVAVPAAQALGAPARAAAERALALYTGAFLAGGEDEAWQMTYRARLASKFKRMVVLSAEAAIARGDRSGARALWERALEFDPLAEDLVRLLMRELIDSGEQAAALAAFERCRDAIATGMGAKPSPATLALLAQVAPKVAP
ncbi:MAG: hypothetical protein HZC37_18455 [Burkholderiales bacterium]|nr:hypothetical protein [Burkholderiales bacterium]